MSDKSWEHVGTSILLSIWNNAVGLQKRILNMFVSHTRKTLWVHLERVDKVYVWLDLIVLEGPILIINSCFFGGLQIPRKLVKHTQHPVCLR